MEWIGTPAVNQTYANARAFFEGKITNMENAARLTGNTAATHGFGTAATASELSEVKDALMGAIKDAVTEAVAEERAAAEEATGNSEEANAITQMRSENKTLREEVAEMSRTLLILSNQVATLRNAITSGNINIQTGDNSNKQPGGDTGEGGGKNKRRRVHPKFGEYKPGMKLDDSWNHAKRHWWVTLAKRDNKNKEAWKAYEKARLEAAMAKVNQE